MSRNDDSEFDEFLSHLRGLPPKDQRFLSRLVTELGRRAPADDASTPDARILQVTREIAPERVAWVAGRLGHR